MMMKIINPIMKVSVIIPTIRPNKLLDLQLSSFINQTFSKENFEVIIIDDYINSNGITRKEKVEKFASSNSLNIKWIKSKPNHYRANMCMGNARNTGLIYAHGDLVIFMDDYSYIRPNYIEKVYEIYKKNKNITHIGQVLHFDCMNPPYPDLLNSSTLPNLSKDPRKTQGICSCDKFFTSNASASLEALIKVNGFWEMADLTREEDILMGYALSRIGKRFYFSTDPDMAVYHMCHGAIPIQLRYKVISYEDIGWKYTYKDNKLTYQKRGTNGLNTPPDTIQLVTPDIFNLATHGSWAMVQHFKGSNVKFNREIGFDLLEERKKVVL